MAVAPKVFGRKDNRRERCRPSVLSFLSLGKEQLCESLIFCRHLYLPAIGVSAFGEGNKRKGEINTS